MKYCLPQSTALVLFIFISLTSSAKPNDADLRIAFMPDIHFHDVYADLTEDGFSGIATKSSGKHATIRTMSAQLQSTRLFNENYFALLAALDSAVQSGIRYIALPGDFSDDGQPVHLEKLAAILDDYTEKYGVQFFSTPGNHDPVRPFDTPGGKRDFLQADGREISIQSPGTEACQSKTGPQSDTLICTPEIRHLGYEGVARIMQNTGLFPQPQYVYWATPFSEYTPDTYDYKTADDSSALSKRQYRSCKKSEPMREQSCVSVPDTSYLVEPVKGIWLLAIDANVYQPHFDGKGKPVTFSGSGNAGYNSLTTDKEYLLEWIEQVVQQAEQKGKRLISFSHFPMVDFYDQQAPAIEALLGQKAFQLQRLPTITTSKRLAQTGLSVHVSGHMHMNDTGIYRSPEGKTLFNIQAPSLAAYPPAYKVLTLLDDNRIEVETVRITQVPRFDELFPHYEREHDYLSEHHPEKAWNRAVLNAKNYNDYTRRHLRELVRLRFLPQEWPDELAGIITESNLEELAILSQLPSDMPLSGGKNIADLKQSQAWKQTADEFESNNIISNEQRKLLAETEGFDLLVDLYMLRNGGNLAQQDMGTERLLAYRSLAQLYHNSYKASPSDRQYQSVSELQHSIAGIMNLAVGFIIAAPDDHVLLDLESGQATSLPNRD